jgi:hypothetical protein
MYINSAIERPRVTTLPFVLAVAARAERRPFVVGDGDASREVPVRRE